MTEKQENSELNAHCLQLLDEYREREPHLKALETIVKKKITDSIKENGIYITTMESRVKEEGSFIGKLRRKGDKYKCIDDITDVLGLRIVTLFSDDVDKIASIIEHLFDIDWANCIDKRKISKLNTFGYKSLHYIARLPKELYFDDEHPEMNRYPFEIQLRTTLQHVWSVIEHNIGYKGGADIPQEHIRTLSILAGMFELADNEFSNIRSSINAYRRQILNIDKEGNLENVALDENSFKNYLGMEPFGKLNKRIAAINQAEVVDVPLMPYLPVLKQMGLNTLGDVERMKKECGDDAYELARHYLGYTDLDIIASSIGLKNLCIVYTLRQGRGKEGLVTLFESIKGYSDKNIEEAGRLERLVNEITSL